MLHQFNQAAVRLRSAKDTFEIETAYKDVLFAFNSDTNSITYNPELTPKIKSRLIERAQEELFDLSVEVLYEMTSSPNQDIDSPKAKLQAATEILNARLTVKELSTQQKQKLFHTRGLVSRHFRDLATSNWGLDAAKRADHKKIADQVGKLAPNPKPQ